MFELAIDDPLVKKCHDWITAKCEGSKVMETYVKFFEKLRKTKILVLQHFLSNFSALKVQMANKDEMIPRPSNVFTMKFFSQFSKLLNLLFSIIL